MSRPAITCGEIGPVYRQMISKRLRTWLHLHILVGNLAMKNCYDTCTVGATSRSRSPVSSELVPTRDARQSVIQQVEMSDS